MIALTLEINVLKYRRQVRSVGTILANEGADSLVNNSDIVAEMPRASTYISAFVIT